MLHHLVTLHLRSRTSLPRRCLLSNRLSNQRQGHRSRRRQLLPQRHLPRPLLPWLLRPSRGRPRTILLPQPRITHHHQNGRLVVSGGERAVDDSWLITFFPPFSHRVSCHSYTFHPGNLLVLLLSISQSQCPLSSLSFFCLPLLS